MAGKVWVSHELNKTVASCRKDGICDLKLLISFFLHQFFSLPWDFSVIQAQTQS